MPLTLIDVGSAPNDGTGDTLRDAMVLANAAITAINTILASASAGYDTFAEIETLLLAQGVKSSTWGSIPSAASNSGRVYRVTDIGVDGGSLWVSDGTSWRLLAPVVLARGNTASSVTGTTSETALATVTVPAGALGTNGTLDFDGLFTLTSSTNTKNCRVRFSGAAGTIYASGGTAVATNISFRGKNTISNRNATGSQFGLPLSHAIAFSTLAPVTSSVDTTAATTLVFTGQLTNTGETITLERYEVILKP